MKDDALTINGTELPAIEAANAQPTAMQMIQMAVQKGADINTIERLVALQEKMLARDAETQFNAAMNRVQTVVRHVAADAPNPQTRSDYASYAALDKMIRPLYCKEGLSLSFNTESTAPDVVRVICYVSHQAGHTRTYHVDMPADGKGAKGGDVMTKTHATGSAMSYGMRYLLKFIFNIAIGEDDDDGNGGEPVFFDDCATMQALQAAFTERFKSASSDGEKKRIIAAKDKRKAELQKKPGKKISEEQRTRFNTLCSKQNMTESDRKALLRIAGYASSSDIEEGQKYEKLCKLVESGQWADEISGAA